MNMIRNIFHSIKATLKFIWRHFLTLSISMIAIDAFLHNNPLVSRVLITLLIAALIDWLKMKIRMTPNSDRMGASIQTLQSQSPCNYHMIGTASYLGNMGYR